MLGSQNSVLGLVGIFHRTSDIASRRSPLSCLNQSRAFHGEAVPIVGILLATHVYCRVSSVSLHPLQVSHHVELRARLLFLSALYSRF